MDRREFLRLSGGAAILGMGFTATQRRPAWAQGTTSLSDLGLPEVTATLTDAGFQVSPSETTAGWTLVTFENRLPEDNFNSASLLLLSEGQTVEDVQDLFATPSADPAPDWIFEATSAGGPMSRGGTSAQAVVNLQAGNWMISSGGEPYAPATLTVAASSEATPTPPTISADIQVAMQEFAFVGLEQAVPAGPRVWEVTTTGEQPHVLILFTVPDGTTAEQLVGGFAGMITGTPAADAVDLASIQPVGGCADLSPGQTAWVSLDLAAGAYGAICFVPDEQTGAPHAMLGMAAVFAVE